MRWQGTTAFMAPRDRYDERDGRSPHPVGHLARVRDRKTYRGTWFLLSFGLVGSSGDP
jgi:hypothetical protein